MLLGYLGQDARYNLSQRPDLTDVAIPNRAAELTQRLAKTMVPFLSRELSAEDLNLNQNYNMWMIKIKNMFLRALRFVVQLQEQSASIVMFWPKETAVFERAKMRALNPGMSDQSREVMLTMLPAVLVEESDEHSQRVLSKAIVYLIVQVSDPNNSTRGRTCSEFLKDEASKAQTVGPQLRQIASVQYSEDTTTYCSRCD